VCGGAAKAFVELAHPCLVVNNKKPKLPEMVYQDGRPELSGDNEAYQGCHTPLCNDVQVQCDEYSTQHAAEKPGIDGYALKRTDSRQRNTKRQRDQDQESETDEERCACCCDGILKA
jgi:hypothetical protein